MFKLFSSTIWTAFGKKFIVFLTQSYFKCKKHLIKLQRLRVVILNARKWKKCHVHFHWGGYNFVKNTLLIGFILNLSL